ncbi:hypothetical protein O3W44_23625 [Pantoea sp. LMR881]|uniref:hypothetical protein n=1 Tax=Pantoea sp. LMR881 TaxID=3014336 RepID=UPI0022AFA3D3|nr:hypothetical protein [Pantoea sp. LMR881]MCZ4061485.1 hypothetical protein [Pantoea sp. LMR881]
MNNSTAVMRASNGASAIIDGKLASTGPAQSESKALELINGSSGINNGVINGGFFNNANGNGVDPSTLGYIGKAVSASSGSQFTNNGVINLAPGEGPNFGRVRLSGWAAAARSIMAISMSVSQTLIAVAQGQA